MTVHSSTLTNGLLMPLGQQTPCHGFEGHSYAVLPIDLQESSGAGDRAMDGGSSSRLQGAFGGRATVGSRSVKTGREQDGLSQNQRRVWRRSRTVKPCQGMSFRWRVYQLWTRPEIITVGTGDNRATDAHDGAYTRHEICNGTSLDGADRRGELVQPATRIHKKECTMSTQTGQPEGQTQEGEQPAQAQARQPQEGQQSPGQQPEGQIQEGQQPEGKAQPDGHQEQSGAAAPPAGLSLQQQIEQAIQPVFADLAQQVAQDMRRELDQSLKQTQQQVHQQVAQTLEQSQSQQSPQQGQAQAEQPQGQVQGQQPEAQTEEGQQPEAQSEEGQQPQGQQEEKSPLQAAADQTGEYLKLAIQSLLQTVRELLTTVRYLLQAVASLLKTVVVALKEGVMVVGSGAAHLLSAVGHQLTEGVKSLLRAVWSMLCRVALAKVLQWLASLIKKPEAAPVGQAAGPAQQEEQPAAAGAPRQAA